MNINDEFAQTLGLVSRANTSNWHAYAALVGMLMMILGMVAMMWFLSSEPTLEIKGILSCAVSIIGLGLWRNMLPAAHAHDKAKR